MTGFRQHILQSINANSMRSAFVIKGVSHSYSDLGNEIADIQRYLQKHHAQEAQFAVMCHDSLTTYAALLGIMMLGKTFVPILPHYPPQRNTIITKLAKTDNIIDFNKFEIDRGATLHDIQIVGANDHPLAILFTSGSTGTPKGVPYNETNINATLDAYLKLGMHLSADDRYLQMFDLNFDMSYLSFLPALLIGASVYTVGHGGVKYLEAVKLMMTAPITVATVVPSTLQLLSPYFESLNLSQLKYTLVGGEPFTQMLANNWYGCAPNNNIYNISGPTETTMACMGYWVPKEPLLQKTHNGILAFGKPWPNTTAIVVDDNYNPLGPNQEGELLFAGPNVMDGYIGLPETNRTVFCTISEITYYKTGDMAFVDDDGIFHTCGRKDNQVKIMGFKVELGEIEFHASALLDGQICVAKYNASTKQLNLYIKASESTVDNNKVLDALKHKLPAYMVPSNIIELKEFPFTNNGKIDKTKL